MSTTNDQVERAHGFLFLNDFDVFVYCCKSCPSQFKFSSDLEEHILSEHYDVKKGIEGIFVSDGVLDIRTDENDQELLDINEIKEEFDLESTEFNGNYSVNPSETDVTGDFDDDGNDREIMKNGRVQAEMRDSFEEKPKERPMTMGRKSVNSTAKTRKTKKPSKLPKSPKTANSPKKVEITRYYCDLCPVEVSFTRKIYIAQHLRKHFPIEKKCPICDETVQVLKDHMKTHHYGLKPFKCTYCPKRFISQSLLKNHIRTHTGERPFLCSSCPKMFKTSCQLSKHIDRIHKNGKPKYSCEQCNLQFLLVSQFESHRLSMHCDERPHLCNLCGARFRTTKTLHNHKFTHAEKPAFPCQYCGKMYKTNDYKRVHERRCHEEVDENLSE